MPYRKGESGNPRGRPKGSPDRRSLLFKELVPHGDKLIAKAVDLALKGDTQMLNLCLNKLLPTPKPVDRHVELPMLEGTLSQKGNAVIDNVASGTITPGEANLLLQALSAQARLVEIDDLLKRVEALESAGPEAAH